MARRIWFIWFAHLYHWCASMSKWLLSVPCTSVGSASNSSLDVHPQVLPSPGHKEGHLVLDHQVWEQAVLRVVETVFASDFLQFPRSQKGRFQDVLEILGLACQMKRNRTSNHFCQGSVCSIFCSCVGVPLCQWDGRYQSIVRLNCMEGQDPIDWSWDQNWSAVLAIWC